MKIETNDANNNNNNYNNNVPTPPPLPAPPLRISVNPKVPLKKAIISRHKEFQEHQLQRERELKEIEQREDKDREYEYLAKQLYQPKRVNITGEPDGAEDKSGMILLNFDSFHLLMACYCRLG